MSSVTPLNPHLPSQQSNDDDYLYHLALSRPKDDLPAMFGDVKFVCVGGTEPRMLQFITYMTQLLDLPQPDGGVFINYAKSANRYALYKSGPIIAASHGIGFSSMTVVLTELIKLLYYAGCTDVRLFRIGTCGGIGPAPGSVIVSSSCVDNLFRNFFEMVSLGKVVQREAVVSAELRDELLTCVRDTDDFDIVTGITMSCIDFYEGQGRLDGAFCDFSKQDKMAYLKSLSEKGVVNFEMEAVVVASFCHHVGIKAAVVCVSIIDRLQGDQIDENLKLTELEKRPQLIVGRYIQKCLQKQ